MIYVTDTPYVIDPFEGIRFTLWADTPDEAMAAIYGCGGDMSQRIVSMNTVDVFAVTPDQFAAALSLGITITDKWGFIEWGARRDGRADRLKVVAELRATPH